MLTSSDHNQDAVPDAPTPSSDNRGRTLWPLVVVAAVAVVALAGIAWLALRADSDPESSPVVGPPSETTTVDPVGEIGSETIVLIGDSHTSLGKWEDLFSTYEIENRGFPGVTTDQLMFTVEDVAASRPRAVLLLSGSNDVALGRPPEWTGARLEELLDVFAQASPDTLVVLQTIPPRADLAGVVPFTNEEIRRVAGERGLPLIDLYPLLDNGYGGLRLGETDDGIHLSETGYLLWSAQLRLFFDAQGW
jgi:lysophospholipase L1-like esterase